MIKFVSEVKGNGFTWNGLASTTDYITAQTYLQKSVLAKTLIENIEKSLTLCINLLITTDPEVPPNYYPYMMTRGHHTSPAGNLVTWNPKGVMNVIAREKGLRPVFGKQSPALALLHEFGHALQHFQRREWFVKTYNRVLNQDDKALLEIENDNINMNEEPVARELGEGIRYAYRDVGNVEYQVFSYTK